MAITPPSLPPPGIPPTGEKWRLIGPDPDSLRDRTHQGYRDYRYPTTDRLSPHNSVEAKIAVLSGEESIIEFKVGEIANGDYRITPYIPENNYAQNNAKKEPRRNVPAIVVPFSVFGRVTPYDKKKMDGTGHSRGIGREVDLDLEKAYVEADEKNSFYIAALSIRAEYMIEIEKHLLRYGTLRGFNDTAIHSKLVDLTESIKGYEPVRNPKARTSSGKFAMRSLQFKLSNTPLNLGISEIKRIRSGVDAIINPANIRSWVESLGNPW